MKKRKSEIPDPLMPEEDFYQLLKDLKSKFPDGEAFNFYYSPKTYALCGAEAGPPPSQDRSSIRFLDQIDEGLLHGLIYASCAERENELKNLRFKIIYYTERDATNGQL